MRSLFALLTLAALCVAAGCDKPEAETTPPDFDKAVDGGIAAPAIVADASILQPPAKIAPVAAPMGAAAAAADENAAYPPATPGDQTAQVTPDQGQPYGQTPADAGGAMAQPNTAAAEIESRQLIASLIDEMKAGNLNAVFDALVPGQARQLRRLGEQIPKVTDAYKRLDQACRTRLGSDLLTLAAGQGGGMSMGGMDVGSINSAVMAGMMPLRAASADEVHILDDSGQPSGVSLVRIDGQWRLQLPPDKMTTIARVANGSNVLGFMQTLEMTFDELARAIEAGQIDRGNFAQAMQGMQQQRIGPATAAMMAELAKELAPASAAEAAPQTDPQEYSPYGEGPLPENMYGPAGGGGGGGNNW